MKLTRMFLLRLRWLPGHNCLAFFVSVVCLIILSTSCTIAFAGSVSSGLDFPGSNAFSCSNSVSVRFRFLNPLPIYPATYIWRAYPREQPPDWPTTQPYYYTTFFWGNDDGNGNDQTFVWNHGSADTYYGAHPYPLWPTFKQKWEIATDGYDFTSVEDVGFRRWYTQALVAWADENGFKHTVFYWDLSDPSKVITHISYPSYGNTNPPGPALTFGDAPWNLGCEIYNGILRGIRVYSTNLSLSNILNEADSPLSTPPGARNIWYLNMDPTPDDISDKSGAGHNPSWVGRERPSLFTENAVDKTPPITTSSLSGPQGTNDWYTGRVAVNLIATDIDDGPANITTYYRLDNGPITTYTGPFTVTDGGIHILEFGSTDRAGNVEAPPRLLQLKIDTTPPVITPLVSGVLGNNNWYRSDVAISWNVADPESGIASTQGCNPITLRGNTAGVLITCSAVNSAGLRANGSVMVKIDQIPPVTSVTGRNPAPNVNGWNNTDVTVGLTAVETPFLGSGVKNITVALSGAMGGTTVVNGDAATVAIAASGITTITYFATDNVGNMEVAKTLVVKVDKIGPEAFGQFDPVTKTVKVFGTSAISGVPAGPAVGSCMPIESFYAGNAGNNDAGDKSLAQRCTYKISDAADNSVVIVDDVKVEDYSDGDPGNESFGNDQQHHDIKVAVASFQYTLGGVAGPLITPQKNRKQFLGSLKQDGTLKGLEQKMVVGTGEDQHQVQAEWEAEKNETVILERQAMPKGGTQEKKITKPGLVLLIMTTGRPDKLLIATPPAVSITSPSMLSVLTGTITVSATASDDVGVVGVQFLLDDSALGAEVKTAPYSVPWDTTKVSNGNHTLTAVARGGAGYTATGAPVVVLVNNSVGGVSAPRFVQGAGGTNDDDNRKIDQAFPVATAPGDLIVVAVSWGNDATVSCSDSQGNTYSVATAQYDSANNQSLAICYAPNAKGGADTITATFSDEAPYRRLLIHEYSGVALTAPVDVVAEYIGNGRTAANAITSTAATTTSSGDLVFGAVMDDTGVNNITAGTGFTQRQSVNNTDLVSEDLVLLFNGTVAATFTFSAEDRYLAQIVTFRHR